MRNASRICLIMVLLASQASTSLCAESVQRVANGLSVLYTFDVGGGATVRDQSGVSPPLDLNIEDLSAVRWQEGFLEISSATKISSSRPARKIIGAVKRSNALTIEAWIKPANDEQKGPARIVSLSAGASRRNFTLGQNGAEYDVRFRSTETDHNGLPSSASRPGTLQLDLTHVVYTRSAQGKVLVYLNGKRELQGKINGKTKNWDLDYRLVLADESGGGRPWLGELHLVAVYSRALTSRDIEQNFRAGPAIVGPPNPSAVDSQDRRFENEIASIIAHNCIECHDAATREGGLDLSHKTAALAGGDSGEVIVPGDADDSLLWQQIASGEMPPEMDSLSPDDLAAVRRWIEDGADWTVDFIDPAVYAQNDGAADVWVQRLTKHEYVATVRGAVDVDISVEVHEILPADVRADGFSNTAYNLNVDLKHVEAYAHLAEIIVSRMDVTEFARRFSKSQKLSTDATMRKFIADMGRWILRGPLDEREVNNYSGIATSVASVGGDYEEAVSYVLEAMLQSPRFIYRVEHQSGDGTAWPTDEYELASRMSYILWGAPPDKNLMRAADQGELYDRSEIEKQVERMLQDPRAVERSTQFIAQWLNLDRLGNLNPNGEKYPNWDNALAADMREETLAFFQEVVWEQNRPLADMFNAQVTYATPRLATHYGLEPKGDGLQRYDLSSVPSRGGLLTQASVLTVGGDDASMVTRGLFVLQDVLRGIVQAPPPGLDTTPVPTRPGLSQRHIAEQRIANVSCGGCHARFEPLAYGLERFDGLGMFHERDEHGNDLRDDGEILFPGASRWIKYESTDELMDLLAESDRVRETITWKVTQFALGRPLVVRDAPVVRQIHESSQEHGGTYASLITAIVMSDLVQLTQTEANEVEINR